MSVRYAVLAGFFSAMVLAFDPTPVAAVQSVNLLWDSSPSSDVAGYKVYYGTESEYYIADIPDGSATNTALSGFSEGVTYYFAIAAYDNSGQEGERSDEVFYTVPGIAPPRAITSIQKSPSGPGVIVTWNPSPSADAVGYNVYFGTQSGSYTIQNFFTGTNGEIFDALDEGATYFFVVTAYDSSGHESVYSSEVAYSIPALAHPGSITSIVKELTADIATVTWERSTSTGVAGYNIYYSPNYTPIGGYYYYSVSVGDTNQAAVYGLMRGVTYYFVVKAYDSSGQESEPSSQASYTVPVLDPPGDITSIEQESAPSVVTLTWEMSTNTEVAGYNVYFSPDYASYGGYSFAASVGNTNQATVYGLMYGVRYYFVVKAYDYSGQESDPSSQASYAVPALDPPGDITSIEPELAPNVVTLTWEMSTNTDVVGYNVYYTPDYAPYGGYYYGASVGNTNQATVYGLMDGVTYYFVVKAYDNSWQESDPSSQASYTVPSLDPPGDITSIRQTNLSVTLSWDPAPGADVIGYNIYFGPYSGYYTGVISVSGTNAAIDGLGAGETYFFAVKSYDNFGRESVPSDEASFTLAAPVVTGPVLELQQLPVAGFQNAFSITSEDPMPASWTMEASSDLQTWRTLTTGNDPSLNVTVVVSAKPKLFFRLNSFYSDINLQTQTDPENGFPNSFFITTQDVVPYLWAVEFSEDLQNWNMLSTGADSRVKVAVVYAETPALFFRLKGQ